MGHALRIGTSGWSYPHWRGVLYERGLPQSRWLERYAECFDTVELNASFYRLPSQEQFAGWKRHTPPDFRFAVKGSRFITHVKRLVDVEAATAEFLSRARGLGRKGTVVLWQLPPHLECDLPRLDLFLKCLPRAKMRRQVIEFRHPTWYCPEVYELLEDRGVALVLPDSASAAEMNAPERRYTADLVYLRFHYGRARGGNYSEAQLQTWARRIARWRRHRDVYIYFNNDWHGFAVRNAQRLRKLVSGGREPRRKPVG